MLLKPWVPETGPGFDGQPPMLEPVEGLTARERQARNCPKRNANHCVVCWLKSQRLISASAHQAAEQLQDDHKLGQVSDIRGSNLEGAGGGVAAGPVTVLQQKLDAQKRKNVVMVFAGEPGASLLTAVVIDGLSLAATARLLRWHEKGVLPALQVALGVLQAAYAFREEVEDGYERHAPRRPHRGRKSQDRTRLEARA